jgi:hypothetical protein
MIDSVGSEASLLLTLSAPYTLFTKAGGNQSTSISLGRFGSIRARVNPGFVLSPWADSSGTEKFVWSGSTPDPRYVQQPADQR